MTIDFTCQKCESSFEIDAQDLIDGTEKLVCPHCNAKSSASMSDDFIAALAELRTQVAALATRFSISMAVETEDVEDEIEEDEDEDEDEGEDDDELDFDEDDETDDEDEEEYEDEDSDDR